MGRPRTLSKQAKKLAKKKGLKPGSVDVGKYSITEILDKADSFIEEYNYEMAQKFLERALQIDSDNPRALETTASLLLEAGEVEKAKQCLGRSITVLHNEGHTKFFTLAQLLNGQDSLELYKQGISILTSALPRLEDADDKKEAAKDLSSAHCAIAELYMTDLCDNPEAEAECIQSITNGVEVDPTNAEAWQTKARLHLIKCEFDQAKTDLNKSLDLWLPNYMAVLENRAHEASKEAFDPVEVCPLLFTTRLVTARMLIELEEWEKANQVLDGLTEEDDEVVDPWYLLGWLNKLRADFEKDQIYTGNARYFLNKAKEVHAKNPTQDQEMVRHIEELLTELGPEEEEAEEEGDAKDEWEDVDSDNNEDAMDE